MVAFKPNTIPLEIANETVRNGLVSVSGNVVELRKGDVLEFVQGRNVLALGQEEILRLISRSLWPRRLGWRRRRKDMYKELMSQLGNVQILAPPIFAGECIPYRKIGFGAQTTPCATMRLVVPDDEFLCGPPRSRVLGAGAFNATAAVMGKRGFCPIPGKIGQVHGRGNGAAIIVNNNKRLENIKAKKGTSIEVPGLLMGVGHGGFLMGVARTLLDARRKGADVGTPLIRVGDPEACGYGTDQPPGDPAPCPPVDEGVMGAPLDSADEEYHIWQSRGKTPPSEAQPGRVEKDIVGDLADLGGRLRVWNGTDSFEAEYSHGRFGMQVPLRPKRLFVAHADPMACNTLPELHNVSGEPAILASRGQCQFDAKARLATEKRASALIVISSDDSIFRMPCTPGPRGGDRGVNVAAVMINKKDGNTIKEMLRSPGGSSNAMVVFDPGSKTDPQGRTFSSR
jgi:hypothetical protein